MTHAAWRRHRLALGLVTAGAAVAALRLRPGADARDTRPPAREPAALTRFADWVPPPPSTRLGCLAAYVWASPMTAAGLVVGLAAGARPEVRDGIVLFRHAKGPTGLVLRRRGFDAAALGHVIVASGTPSDALLAHELVHVRQAERLGALFCPAYLGLLATHGYARHPMERAAHLGARLALPTQPPA